MSEEVVRNRSIVGPFDLDADRLAAVSVLVAGAGNIGSPLAPQLARAGVGLLRIVDRDRVEEKNLATQDFRPADVGRFKADVLAERLREQFPGVRVEARACDLEDLPLGEADVDVLLGALDSRRARQVLVSDLGWPLGVPVVDGGVGEGLVGRVQVFLPGPASACLECTWGREDYRQLAAEYPCQPGADARGRPTVSTAFLGNFTAAVMAAECLRVLAGRAGEDSYEVPFDLTHHQFRRYLLRRAAACRHDHQVIADRVILEKKDPSPTVEQVLTVIAERFGDTWRSTPCGRVGARRSRRWVSWRATGSGFVTTAAVCSSPGTASRVAPLRRKGRTRPARRNVWEGGGERWTSLTKASARWPAPSRSSTR
jgi:molybdopterin/thiamine biosynthesis adenylyltransferase